MSNLPKDSHWKSTTPVSNFSVSHGTPSVSPNKIWLWSYFNVGEGVNLHWNFNQGKTYCLKSSVKLTTG